MQSRLDLDSEYDMIEASSTAVLKCSHDIFIRTCLIATPTLATSTHPSHSFLSSSSSGLLHVHNSQMVIRDAICSNASVCLVNDDITTRFTHMASTAFLPNVHKKCSNNSVARPEAPSTFDAITLCQSLLAESRGAATLQAATQVLIECSEICNTLPADKVVSRIVDVRVLLLELPRKKLLSHIHTAPYIDSFDQTE